MCEEVWGCAGGYYHGKVGYVSDDIYTNVYIYTIILCIFMVDWMVGYCYS